MLDGITRTCAEMCGVRMGVCTFPDFTTTDHMFIASHDHGPNTIPFPWETMKTTESVCAVAMDNVDETGFFQVDDLTKTQDFCDARVVREGGLRFYAGVALVANVGGDQVTIGMLCLLDTEPKILSKEQRHLLRVLACNIMTHLDLRVANRVMECDSECRVQRATLEAEVAAAHRTSEQVRHAMDFLSHETRNQLLPMGAVINKSPDEVDEDDLLLLRTCTTAVDNILDNVLLMSKVRVPSFPAVLFWTTICQVGHTPTDTCMHPSNNRLLLLLP